VIDLLEAQGAMISAGHAPTAEAVMLAWAIYTEAKQSERADALVADFVALRHALPEPVLAVESHTGAELTCPACGRTHTITDLTDAWPPIPYSAWPERYGLDDGEGGRYVECACGELLEHDDIKRLLGLPDFPWREPDPNLQPGKDS
jgi:hypothetical protein